MRDGRATFIGYASHATYPLEASGTSHAIVDARVLRATICNQDVTTQARNSYEAIIQSTVKAITRANRARQAPDPTMQIVKDNCDGDFSRLDQTLPYVKCKAHTENIKKLAALDIRTVNAQPSVIDLK